MVYTNSIVYVFGAFLAVGLCHIWWVCSLFTDVAVRTKQYLLSTIIMATNGHVHSICEGHWASHVRNVYTRGKSSKCSPRLAAETVVVCPLGPFVKTMFTVCEFSAHSVLNCQVTKAYISSRLSSVSSVVSENLDDPLDDLAVVSQQLDQVRIVR